MTATVPSADSAIVLLNDADWPALDNPLIIISDAASVTEGNAGSVSADFTISLSASSSQPVSVV